MRSAAFGILTFVAAGLAAPHAMADNLQSSFTSLIAKDYEVRSVTLIPLEVAKRATESVKTDTVVVTLQNKQSVAVCYIAFANWAFMNKTSLDTATLCEVRDGTPAAPEESTPPASASAP